MASLVLALVVFGQHFPEARRVIVTAGDSTAGAAVVLMFLAVAASLWWWGSRQAARRQERLKQGLDALAEMAYERGLGQGRASAAQGYQQRLGELEKAKRVAEERARRLAQELAEQDRLLAPEPPAPARPVLDDKLPWEK